ncbi:MAG: DUF2493 domain-containing protein [Candidatus Cloacimonetes bacterium]|nr:DUF2493 domain-containing protein [Candidatus Cloacimonadota bacterium]
MINWKKKAEKKKSEQMLEYCEPRLAVIGNKEFSDYNFLRILLDKFIPLAAIVSGGAAGTDSLARKYSADSNIAFKEFLPIHVGCGDDAKHRRDRLIVDNCDLILAIWDGKCTGTKYTLEYGIKKGKPIAIINLNKIRQVKSILAEKKI